MPKTSPRVNRIWLALMGAIHERIKQLGLTMEEVDARAGFQERYTAKLLHPATASGRVARWFMMQVLIDTLWPEGCDLEIRELQARVQSIARMHGVGRGPVWLTHEHRKLGGRQRWAKVSPEARSELARRASLARWGRKKARRA